MSNKRGNVLIAAPVHPVLTEGLTALGYTCIGDEKITQPAARTLIADCVGVITSTRLQFDADLLDAAPNLQWIGRMGSGMEVIDVDYAAARGIRCYASPEGNCNAVGEHALGMLLSLIRRIPWSQNEILAGVWKRDENRGTELENKTVGIIGYGHTGAAFAKKLSGFDVRILAYDKYNTAFIAKGGAEAVELNELMHNADIISFHVPLQEDTVYYFDEAFVERVRKPFILINTSRGQVVDTVALYKGITGGKIIGACLDVFEAEPITNMSGDRRQLLQELMAAPNIIVTPHIAGYTFEALYKMSKILLDKILG